MSYYGYGYQEEMDSEFNARFDYVSEAYGATARDCNEMARAEAEDEMREYCAIMEPEYGPYVARPWKGAFGYSSSPDTPINADETEYGPFTNTRRNLGFDDLPW